MRGEEAHQQHGVDGLVVQPPARTQRQDQVARAHVVVARPVALVAAIEVGESGQERQRREAVRQRQAREARVGPGAQRRRQPGLIGENGRLRLELRAKWVRKGNYNS